MKHVLAVNSEHAKQAARDQSRATNTCTTMNGDGQAVQQLCMHLAQKARKLAGGLRGASIRNGEREELNARIGAQRRFGLKLKLSNLRSFEQ